MAAQSGAEPLYPISISLTHPGPQDLSHRFEEARTWIRELEEGAKPARGYGYEIVRTEINNRHIGRNSLPTAILIQGQDDALRLIGKVRDAARFQSLSALTLKMFPELEKWISAKPLKVLSHVDTWERLLAVLGWLRRNPKPGIYLRQIDLPGVDTKFIESNGGILTELFAAMEMRLVPQIEGRLSFESKFGFLSKPTLIRFRILDPAMRIQGLSDLSVPVEELAMLALPVNRVFITENDINGLAFPALPGSLVIFGLGYGVESLSAIPWLREVEIFYWGDIDTHGFAILDRLRASFPDCRSILMDRETLMAHQGMWVEERVPSRANLTRLTQAESGFYADLMGNRIGENLRLEQERIGFEWVKNALPGA